ncbi:MAG: divergent polysaccharide deacetylase family protein [Alphaproteobacteria bacterium]
MKLIKSFVPLSYQSVLIGALAVAFVYAGGVGYALFGKGTDIPYYESRLASQSIPLIRDGDGTSFDHETDSASTPISISEVIPTSELPEAAQDEAEPPSLDEPIESSAESLASAPIAGFYEMAAGGVILPIIRKEDNQTPFEAYKAPFSNPDNRPIIAIAIQDFGLSKQNAALLNDALPAAVTFLASPYADDADTLQKSIRAKGREFWLQIPLENARFPLQDPGMMGILSRLDMDRNMQNFRWAMGRWVGYAGTAGFVDSNFIRARATITTLMRENFDRGLGFFDMHSTSPLNIDDLAQRAGRPYVKGDVLFADPRWENDFAQAAELAIRLAENRGFAVIVLPPYLESAEHINALQRQLQQKNIKLAPLSAIYAKSRDSQG